MAQLSEKVTSEILENIEKNMELYLQITKDAPKNNKVTDALVTLGTKKEDIAGLSIFIAGLVISTYYQ
ncbi:hypothetical protein DUK53_13090 [Listeria sp. SHR_NRA_18]|uniref:hypothetical protein n=1 Tax=Listeria sp. SHR_NRA_18 TaxID=2269046 RepID=UPI000F5E64E7|nr:hypothetical protein [Listeria sp. SHR_NRA_18]RQW65989.1 hypothetical protein DUK53_13090 [Listeria sp. SHR_NRA_18]